MPDEYHARYQGLSHEELYHQLKAGDAEQVDDLASKWASVERTVGGLADALQGDLARLGGEWDSASGTEYRERIGAIRRYAAALAEESRRVHDGLSLMSGPLRTAQQQAESPEETDDSDKTLKGAAVGSVLGLPGAIVGGIWGHKKDQEERAKAHNRMVQLVAGLAGTYRVTTNGTMDVAPPTTPPNLPGSADGSGYQAAAGPRPGPPRQYTGTGAGTGPGRGPAPSRDPDGRDPGPDAGGRGPDTDPGDRDGGPRETVDIGGRDTGGTDGSGGPTGTTPGVIGAGPQLDGATGVGFAAGTALSGAGDSVSNPVLGAWSVGAAGLVAAAGAAAAPSGSQLGQGITGGVLGAPAGVAPAAETARAAAAPGGGRAGGPGLNDLGIRNADQARPAAGVGPGRAGNADGEPDERLTWLNEDEMVWQGDEQAPPPVLGG